jgi:DNA adenine methylase
MGIRQPFSYYGGKQKMVRHILPILKQIPHTVYGEPFCGGASLLFAKEPYSVGNLTHCREFLNDTNAWVTTFYRVGQRSPDELLSIINETLYSEADYNKARAILKDSESNNELLIAWAFYVQANMSFANKLFAGWGSSVISSNQAATWDSRKLTLPESLNRLARVNLSCNDALSVIKRWDSPHTLMYLDPPYPETNQGHYAGYGINDYQALCDLLDNSQCSYILSNYSHVIKPKSAQKMIEIATLMSASGKGKVNADRSQMPSQESLGDRSRTEMVLICDRSSNMRDDIASIAARQLSEALASTWMEERSQVTALPSKPFRQMSLFF